jgi:6-bladed beta-propeller
MRGALLVIGMLCMTSCGGGAPSSGPPQVDSLADGRLVVRNTAAGQWPGDQPWQLREDLRIGAADDPGPDQFGRIDGIVADARGWVYVLDGMAQEIRIFDSDGVHQHTVGGEGGGPLEFGGVRGMSISADGHLWVVDAGNNRYSVFDGSGELVQTYPRAVVAYAQMLPNLDDDSLVEWAGVRGATDDTRGWTAVRFTPPAQFDTLGTIVYRFGTVAQGAVMTEWNADLTGSPSGRGTFWVASMDEYQVHEVSLAGDTLLTFSRPVHGAPVTTAEKDSVVRFFEQFGVEIDGGDLPTTKLVVRRILDDGAGHVLVFPQEAGVPEGSVVDVFSIDGSFYGQVALPARMNVRPDQPSPFSDGSHLYMRTTDALGVHYVSRLQIVRGG